ncbi:hypothetical protein [Polyangium fumosum]|uniref:Uncharacterized protein n=1 Tax=Polyangium fumosum TaxID=889272 RepID=A0A4U1J699_9BACT|nr:hypothetical protein [Polyangium fumosum]TKD02783.1 hypothetical protein E8A74_28215 [Polyangium fumosum]
MADGSRFPQLAPPFAIAGAAAGWLSAGLLANPLVGVTYDEVKPLAALGTTLIGAATGVLLKKLCLGWRYGYEIEAPDPETRSRTDRIGYHVFLVLLAGAAAGALVAGLDGAQGGTLGGAVSGAVSAVLFLPVCLLVLASARRAQRARLGSIVAGSDRRAVWGILAAALSAATLLAALDWPAARMDEVEPPFPALFILLATALVTLVVLAADLRALKRAQVALAPGLQADEEGIAPLVDPSVPRVDLGLGDDIASRLARSAAAYRGRDRAVELVQGNPAQALGALRRAVRRGVTSLALMGVILGAHGLAHARFVTELYVQFRCDTMWPAYTCQNDAFQAIQQAR